VSISLLSPRGGGKEKEKMTKLAWKYADPIEDRKWIEDERELLEVYREDPSLIILTWAGLWVVKERFCPEETEYMTEDEIEERLEKEAKEYEEFMRKE